MNVQELRNAVRAQLDLPEEDDIPTALLDLYLAEGFEQVINLEQLWPFYQTTWSVDVPTTNAVALPVNLESITSVREVGGLMLTDVPFDDAEERFADESEIVGQPELYATWGNQLYLWPANNEARTYTVRGYRQFNPSWISAAGNTPDTGVERRLDRCLVHYACYRVYAQQEDEILSAFYFSSFERTMYSARDAIMRHDHQGRIQMGSGLG